MMKELFTTGPWAKTHLVQWVTIIIVMIHVGLGTAILSGGSVRFSIPSYNPLIDYTYGNTWIWGVWIMISSMLMAAPFRWLNILGLWLGMFWHTIWMACFTIATIRYETAAATPIPAYGGLAMLCAALLTARVIDNKKE